MTRGISGMVMAIMTVTKPDPASATMATASKIEGIAINPSTIRIMIRSNTLI